MILHLFTATLVMTKITLGVVNMVSEIITEFESNITDLSSIIS